MKKIIPILSFALVFSLIVSSCKKGDTGPAGATGATGAAGASGSTGATGSQGPAGTANVIYSDWFTPATYTKDTVFGIWGLNYNKAVTSITQPILDSGAVLTFAKLAGYVTAVWPTGQVAQMPITLTYISGSTVTDTWSALATVGNLHIRFVNDHNIYNSISNAHQFRYIIIPGGKSGGRLMTQTYQQICQQYHIPE